MTAIPADPSRVNAALSLALAGAISTFAVLLSHELLVFGDAALGLIVPDAAPCPAPPCLTVELIVWGHIAKAVGAAFVFALVGAIWTRGPLRWWLAGVVWVVEYLWSLVGIASGYRAHFGTGWAWWEPFAQLLWNPVTTPGLMLAGLMALFAMDRFGRSRAA